MFALKSTRGLIPSYAKLVVGEKPLWGPVEGCTKFPTESMVLLTLLRVSSIPEDSVKGLLEIAELDHKKGKQRYRLPEGTVRMEYTVFSSDRTKSYNVCVSAIGEGSCTCPDWKYRHAEDGTPCKHMRAVLGHLPTLRGDVYFDIEEESDGLVDLRY